MTHKLTPWAAALVLAAAAFGVSSGQAGWTVVAWNNLGMHCMDADYAVFSILPPYNVIHAQVVDDQGRLVTNATGLTVTYEAIADPAGSINTTSAGKTNFWDHVLALFGAAPPVDTGLAGASMPGAGNTPRVMAFDATLGWWIADGIPITPYDDTGHKNPYPMMRVTVRNAAGELAHADVVLPVSDEMACLACHGSNTHEDARPNGGWVNDPDPERDYRLNILRLHDERRADTAALYQASLLAGGYDAAGLYATVVESGTPILCARCHASNALPGTGQAGVSRLTRVVHHRHNFLDASLERGSCYECHPGSATRCLRGVMGAAVAADGTMAIQCQGCHGTMSQVGALQRQGWLDEPMCQNCHTGTAVTNSGEIRFTSALDSGGRLRAAADGTFATEADAPGPGLSLYRFSFGHGGLACEACHGSTHAEYASTHANDNIQSIALQGHAGPLAECASCHGTSPRTANGGPHGMHPVGEPWVGDHQERAEHGGASACRECHGTDFRGTVLSRSRADRSLRTKFGTKDFWRGFQVGCFGCHDGPNSEHRNGNRAPVAQGASVLANAGLPLTVTLAATDADRDALALRIVSQPAHGTVGLSGNEARYFPESGYEGADSFTFAAWDGQTDSNLATVSLGIGSVPGPRIASAKGSGSKLKLQGTDFSPNCTVRIDGYPAPRTICTSTQAVSKGKDLKQMLPKGVTVQITLTNNDTGLVSDAFPYTR